MRLFVIIDAECRKESCKSRQKMQPPYSRCRSIDKDLKFGFQIFVALRESARCGLPGQGQRFASGETLSEFPKLLVDANVLVEAGHGSGAWNPATIGEEAAPLALTPLQQIRLKPIEGPPEIVA
jgi:hypothetical protein